jgi:hypothetical protein
MVFKRIFVLSLLSVAGASGITASGSSTPLARFDFEYMIQGEGKGRPLQVFDDGQRTYLQYRATEDIPAFISIQSGQLLYPKQDGPYTVLAGLQRDFVAQTGATSIRITHSSEVSNAPQYLRNGERTSVPTDRVQLASLKPVAGGLPPMTYSRNETWADNSYATPARGDQIAWAAADTESTRVVVFERGTAKLDLDAERKLKAIAAEIVGAKRVVIHAADDTHPADVGGTERAKKIQDRLVAAGINPSIVSVKVGFLFDDQLQRSGKKAYNPTSISWTTQAPQPTSGRQSRFASTLLESDAVVNALRSGRISTAQALDALKTSAGVQAPGPTQPSARPTVWAVRKADQNIEKMLGRWAGDAGWKVVWNGAPTVAITADGDRPLTHPDFLKAADYVVTQAKGAGYHLKATAYSNQVLVITGE